jgi:hypothetical protein
MGFPQTPPGPASHGPTLTLRTDNVRVRWQSTDFGQPPNKTPNTAALEALYDADPARFVLYTPVGSEPTAPGPGRPICARRAASAGPWQGLFVAARPV